MKVLVYWAARTALFFAVLVALWGVGWRHWTVAIGAALFAWVISYAMFGSMYDAAAQQLERSLGLFGERDGDDEAIEDAATDDSAARKASEPRSR